jgi:hypothetical protein
VRKWLLAMLVGVVGCGEGVWEELDPGRETPGDSQRVGPHELATLNAGEIEYFGTYVLWGWTTWRVRLISPQPVPYKVSCRDGHLSYEETLSEEQSSMEMRWRCQGSELAVANLGRQDGRHIIEVTVY